MKKIIFTFLGLSYCLLAFSQNNRINPNDAYILNENIKLVVNGVKLDFIYYNFTIDKTIVVKTQKGIEQIQSFRIPDNFDPSLIKHFPEARNYQHAFMNIEVKEFKVSRKNKSFNTKVNHNLTKHEIEIVTKDNRFDKHYYYEVSMSDILLGDTLKLIYKYSIKLSENIYNLMSMRYFFHSHIDKKQSNLQITKAKIDVLMEDYYHSNWDSVFEIEGRKTILKSKKDLRFKYYNQSDPDSVLDSEFGKTYYWHKHNIKGCIGELGSRPYRELPYLTLNIEPDDIRLRINNSLSYQKFLRSNKIPSWSLYALHREGHQLKILKDIEQGISSKQYRLLNSFVSSFTDGVKKDTSGSSILKKLLNKVADDFTYVNDIEYFRGEDMRDPRFGEFIVANKLRDICRYDSYIAMLRSAGFYYYSAYLIDKRSGAIDNSFFGPMNQSDYLISPITHDNKIHYIYPKKSRFGYYLNELPFYFSNTFTYLLSPYDLITLDSTITKELINTYTPKSSLKSNQRTSNVMVDVNLQEKRAEFKGQIKLKGQYSTMCRGSYLYNESDRTVNPLYAKKIWDINGKVTVQSDKTVVKKKEFPFDTQVSCSYTAENIIHEQNDTISIDLNNWFNHIIIDGLNIEDRELTFYADFLGMDTYVYYLKFTDNVSIIDDKMKTEISNDFGKYILVIDQVQPNAIKISSSFITHNNVVQANEIKAVQDIYNKIDMLNNYKLKLLKK